MYIKHKKRSIFKQKLFCQRKVNDFFVYVNLKCEKCVCFCLASGCLTNCFCLYFIFLLSLIKINLQFAKNDQECRTQMEKRNILARKVPVAAKKYAMLNGRGYCDT